MLAELDGALEHHELIKIRVRCEDRQVRDAVLSKLIADSGAALIQRIGHVALIYRPAEKPKIMLPKPPS